MKARQRTRRGVTFLELLMVMAIIALLLSIFLPVMSHGRDETIKAQCMNNLRQIMAFATIYAYNDPKTIVSPVHPEAGQFVGGGYAEYGGGPGSMQYMGWGEDFDPRSRPLNALVFGKGGIVGMGGPGMCPQFELFRCPGNDLGWQEWPGFGGDPRESERPYYVANGTSYRMNNLSYTSHGSVGIYGRPLTRVPVPGLTIAFMEARVWQTIWTNDTWGSLPSGELTGYHRLRAYFNVAYADGHVDYVNFGRGTYYQHLTWPAHPEWVGMDVRGSWGRMDCLPDPPIDLE